MIGFMHIPKTGGTTIRKAMTEAGLSVWMPRGKWRNYIVRIGNAPIGPVEVDVIAGHLPHHLRPNLPDVEWFTVLRHPVERWLSHRNVLGHDPAPNLITEFLGDGGLAPYFHVGRTDRLDQTLDALGLPRVAPERMMDRPRGGDVPADLWARGVEQNRADLEIWEAYVAA